MGSSISLMTRLAALELAAGQQGPVVVFGVDDQAFQRISATARVAGRRVVRWPLPPPPIERINREVTDGPEN